MSLRASGRTLKAEVVVGANKYGGRVSVNVQVNPHDEVVAAALRPLIDLLSERALSEVNGAKDELEIQTEVRERVRVAVDRERERLKKNGFADAEAAYKEEIRQERNLRLRAEEELRRAKLANERLQAKAAGS